MTDMQPSDTSQQRSEDSDGTLQRRKFLAASCGAGVTMFAGCASESDPDSGSTDDSSDDTGSEDDSDGTATESGSFRLLISDMPADIGDFDRLYVSFDRARIFEGGGDSEAGETDADSSGDGPAGESTDGAGQGGFYNLDLDGATVDLTQVVDDRAISVFDGELSEGRYTKIELYVADIEGVVGGEVAEVKVPSGKLQITQPFEVVAGESVDFVFDINVVKRGRALRYNLTPVISKSGVRGKDVEVDEVGGEGESDEGEGEENGGDAGESDEEETGEEQDGGDETGTGEYGGGQNNESGEQ